MGINTSVLKALLMACIAPMCLAADIIDHKEAGCPHGRRRGPPGPTGMTGVGGATGPTGLRGPTGTVGPTGPTGTSAPLGATGPTGLGSITGATGSAGLIGPTGTSGPIGPVEATTTLSNAYLSVSQSVAANTPIIFNQLANAVGNISYNSGTGTFTITETGYYLAYYGAAATMTIGLELNGSNLANSIFGADGSVDCLCAIFHVTTTPSTVRIMNPGSTVLISGLSGAVVAYVSIKRVDF